MAPIREGTALRVGDLVFLRAPAINGYLRRAWQEDPLAETQLTVFPNLPHDVSTGFKEACVFQLTTGTTFEDGNEITFGSSLKLLHIGTNKLVSVKQYATGDLERSNNKVILTEDDNDGTMFKILPRYRIRAEGERARQNDFVVFFSRDYNMSLHMSEEADPQKNGRYEVNATLGHGNIGWRISIYTPFHPMNDKWLKAGDIIRLFHKEDEGFLAIEYGDRSVREILKSEYELHEGGSEVVFLRTAGVARSQDREGEIRARNIHNSNVLFQVELDKPDMGGPVSWGDTFRLRHLGANAYLCVKKRSDKARDPSPPKKRRGESIVLAPGTSQRKWTGVPCVTRDPKDRDTLFLFRPALPEESGPILVGSNARLEHHHSEALMHPLGNLYPGGTDMWRAERVLCLGETFEEDVFGVQAVSEEILSAFKTVIAQRPVLSRFLQLLEAKLDEGKRCVLEFKEVSGAKAVLGDLIRFLTVDTNDDPLTREGAPVKPHQKLVRDQKLVDIVLDITQAPFSKGHLKEKPIAIKDSEYRPLFETLILCFRFLKQVCKENFKMGQHIYTFMPKFQLQLGFGLKIADTVMEMFRDNTKILQNLDVQQVDFFIFLITQYGTRARYLNFMQVLCCDHGRGIYANQEAIRTHLLMKNKNLLLTTRMDDTGEVRVYWHTGVSVAVQDLKSDLAWVNEDWKKILNPEMQKELPEYYRLMLVLFSKLCLSRNHKAAETVSTFVDLNATIRCITDERLGLPLRTAFIELLLTCFVDVDPLDHQCTINYTRMYDDLDNTLAQKSIDDGYLQARREDVAGPLRPSPLVTFQAMYQSIARVKDWVLHYIATKIDLISGEGKEAPAQAKQNVFHHAVLELARSMVSFLIIRDQNELDALENGIIKALGKNGQTAEQLAQDHTSYRHRTIMECKLEMCRILDLLWNHRTNERLSQLLQLFRTHQPECTKAGLEKRLDVMKECRFEKVISDMVKEILKESSCEHRHFGSMAEFQRCRDVILTLTLYDEPELASVSMKLLTRLFSQTSELSASLNEVQLLVGGANLANFLRIKNLQSQLRGLCRNGIPGPSHKEDLSQVMDILGEFVRLCTRDEPKKKSETGVIPDRENQRIFRNLGVHQDMIDLLQIPFDNKPEERHLWDILLHVYLFLKAFAMKNSTNQDLLVKYQRMWLPHMGFKLKVADTLTEVFKNNRSACGQASTSLLTHFVNLVVTAGAYPRYLRFLKIVVLGEGVPLRDNQLRVQKLIMEQSEKTLHLFKDEGERGTFRYAKLQELVEANNQLVTEGPLNYHLQLVDLLALCADMEGEAVRAQLHGVLSISEILTVLCDPKMRPMVKIPYLRFLHHVHMRRRNAHPLDLFPPSEPLTQRFDDFLELCAKSINEFVHTCLGLPNRRQPYGERRLSLYTIAETSDTNEGLGAEQQGFVLGTVLPFLNAMYSEYFPPDGDEMRYEHRSILLQNSRKILGELVLLLEVIETDQRKEVRETITAMRALRLEDNTFFEMKLNKADYMTEATVHGVGRDYRLMRLQKRNQLMSLDDDYASDVDGVEMMERVSRHASEDISCPENVILGLKMFSSIVEQRARASHDTVALVRLFEEHLVHLIDKRQKAVILEEEAILERQNEKEHTEDDDDDPILAIAGGLSKVFDKTLGLAVTKGAGVVAGVLGPKKPSAPTIELDLAKLYFERIIGHLTWRAQALGSTKDDDSVNLHYLRILRMIGKHAWDPDYEPREFLKKKSVLDKRDARLGISVGSRTWQVWVQEELEKLGIVQLVCNLINCGRSNIVYEALKLGITLLEGGNLVVQNAFQDVFSADKDVLFTIRGLIRRFVEEMKKDKDILDRYDKENRNPIVFMRVILKFLQLLCEGHNAFMQTFLRQQDDHDEPVDLINEVLAFYQTFHSDVLESLNGTPLASEVYGLEKRLALTVQVFDFFTEVCQRPCPENQAHLMRGNVCTPLPAIVARIRVEREKAIESLSSIYASGEKDYKAGELEAVAMEIETIEQHMTKVEMSILLMLVAILEGNNDSSVYLRMIQALSQTPHPFTQEFDILFNNLDRNVELSHHMMNAVSSKYRHRKFQGKKLGDGKKYPLHRIYSRDHKASLKSRAKDHVDIGFLYYTLVIILSEREGGKLQERYRAWESSSVNDDYLRDNMGRIEILRDGCLEKVYFRVPDICLHQKGNPSFRRTKEQLLYDVKRNNPTDKIQDFLIRQDQLMDVMKHNEWLATKTRSDVFKPMNGIKFLGKLLAKYDQNIKWLALIVAFVINLLMVLFFRTDDVKRNGALDGDPELIILILAIAHVVLSGMMFVAHFVSVVPVVITQGWKRRQEASYLDPTFYIRSAFRILEMLIRTERLTNLVQSLIFAMKDPGTLYLLGYTALSIVGATVSPFFFAFHLMDMALRFRLSKATLESVGKNFRSLAQMVTLGLIIIYIYGVISFNFFQTSFDWADRSFFTDNFYLWSVSFWDYGFRGAPVRDITKDEETFGMFAYNLTYTILVILIMVAIISGIIIDSFGELRDTKRKIEDDMNDKCFVCSIDRDQIEHKGGGFIRHIKQEHNMWDYLFFRMYLDEKPRTEFTGQESYVRELIDKKEIKWFPINRAMSLEAKLDLEEEAKQQRIEMRLERIESAQDEILSRILLDKPAAPSTVM